MAGAACVTLEKTMIIKPKCDIRFAGAKSGKRMCVLAGVPVEIDAEEIPHLDPADYAVVEAGKVEEPAPLPPSRKKK